MHSPQYHPNILVVDDSSLNLTLIGKMLTRLECHWSAADSGAEALRQLHEQSFDLVLMDCMMTGLDGLETTRLIRAPESPALNSKIPIIAVTAYVTEDNRTRCREAGMNDFIEKPITVSRLEEVIQRWSVKNNY